MVHFLSQPGDPIPKPAEPNVNKCRKGGKVTAGQEAASAIPGNIGIVKSRVLVWEHDPFYARPKQHTTFTFNPQAESEMGRESSPNVEFLLNGVFLKPIYDIHDTFLATRNKNVEEFINPVSRKKIDMSEAQLDILGSLATVNKQGKIIGGSDQAVNAHSRLPGGADYNRNRRTVHIFNDKLKLKEIKIEPVKTVGKDLFPHQLWLYVGSLLKYGPVLHPSEYGVSLGEIAASRGILSRQDTNRVGTAKDITLEELAAAPEWTYTEVIKDGRKVYWPDMTSKQNPDLQTPTHWTIEKYTPTFQGEDFFVTIKIGEREKDHGVTPGVAVEDNDAGFRTDILPHDTFGWGSTPDGGSHYSNLMYDPPNKHRPSRDHPGWKQGISNEAYFIDSQVDAAEQVEGEEDAARKKYWWGPKTYILIEIGAQHPIHNYFIELVEGRSPRFIHLGEEWDIPNRLEAGLTQQSFTEKDFDFIRKSRVLSVYHDLTVDALFASKEVRISVRHHLGKLIITFEGYEDNPWIVARTDNDSRFFDFSQIQRPVMVPAYFMRIHGGNIPAAIGFAPIRYDKKAIIPFKGIQADTGVSGDVDELRRREISENLYMTFANIGNSFRYQSTNSSDNVSKFIDLFFYNNAFKFLPIGYSCDAAQVIEFNRNESKPMEVNTDAGIYEIYSDQYKLYGKGWIWVREDNGPLVGIEDRIEGIDQRIDPNTGLLSPHKLINGMTVQNTANRNPKPSKLSIINIGATASGPVAEDQEFNIIMEEGVQDKNYPYWDKLSIWDVGVKLEAGTVVIPKLEKDDQGGIPPIDKSARHAVFTDTVTPIATNWSLIIGGGGKPIADNVAPFDITELVTKIEDSWSAEDFHKINHEMQISCYIPLGTATNGSGEPIKDKRLKNLLALGERALKLHNKSFYLTVYYWWENGVGERDAPGNEKKRFVKRAEVEEEPQAILVGNSEDDENLDPGDFVNDEDPLSPGNSDLLIQMTGVAFGAELERSVNKLFMHFTVKDYMSIFEKQFIWNSPFFDGVQDVLAVYELAKLAGFDYNTIPPLPDPNAINNLRPFVDRRPLGYLQKVLEETAVKRAPQFKGVYNGEKSRNRIYDLPGTYADIANPSVRFQNGETFDSAFLKIAQLGAKTIYFDRWGVLKMENSPALEAAFISKNDKLNFEPKFEFVTSPFQPSYGICDPITNEPRLLTQGDRSFGGGKANDELFLFDPNKHASHLVYNVVTYSRSVEDCINQIVLASASNDLFGDGSAGGLVFEGYTFYDQIWNPEAEGFFGFRKPFYQSEGAFGDIQGVRLGLAHYARMKYPPIDISFQTYGVPGLRALDIITLDDNLYYITQISHELDPETNNWWMNISGEWLKPFLGDLGFLEEKGETDTSRVDELLQCKEDV